MAQLGARMTGSHEVGGSNPPRSTNQIKGLNPGSANHKKYHFVQLLLGKQHFYYFAVCLTICRCNLRLNSVADSRLQVRVSH